MEFYIFGCVLSLVFHLILAKDFWDESSKDEKMLTVLLWFPFVTLISWFGVILFAFIVIGRTNNLDNDEDL